MPLADALALAKARRACVHPNAGFLDALRRFQATTAAGPAPPPTRAAADEGAQEFADAALAARLGRGDVEWGGYDEYRGRVRDMLLQGRVDYEGLAELEGHGETG